MKTDPHWTSVEAAVALLPDFSRKFYRAGREAFEKGDSESLHEFRIAAKKFRYALELFQPLYGPQFAQKLARLKKLQDYLGHLNDLATVRLVLRGQESGEFLAWAATEEADHRKKLTEYWTKTMDAPGVEEKWSQYLARYAGRAAKTAS
jgi:CHAD domain-containing protein